MKEWVFNVGKFFISNQSPQLADIEQPHLAEVVIPILDSILWEAEQVKVC